MINMLVVSADLLSAQSIPLYPTTALQGGQPDPPASEQLDECFRALWEEKAI